MNSAELLKSAREVIEALIRVAENLSEQAEALGIYSGHLSGAKMEHLCRQALMDGQAWLAEELKSRTKVAEQSAFFEKFNEQVGRVESAGLSSALHVIGLLRKALNDHAGYISRGDATEELEELEELDAAYKRAMEESRDWVQAYSNGECQSVRNKSVFYDGPMLMAEVSPSAVEKAFELVVAAEKKSNESISEESMGSLERKALEDLSCMSPSVQDGNRSGKSSVRAEAFDVFRDRSVKSMASDIADQVITFLKDFMTPVVQPVELQEVKESRARAELERLRSMPDCAFIAPPVELVVTTEKKNDLPLSDD